MWFLAECGLHKAEIVHLSKEFAFMQASLERVKGSLEQTLKERGHWQEKSRQQDSIIQNLQQVLCRVYLLCTCTCMYCTRNVICACTHVYYILTEAGTANMYTVQVHVLYIVGSCLAAKILKANISKLKWYFQQNSYMTLIGMHLPMQLMHPN